MNLSQRSLNPFFIIALLLTLFCPLYFPKIKLLWFAPGLIALYYQKPITACLWASLVCGTLIDLTTSTEHFGLHALNYITVSAVLYGQKRHFFGDSLSTLPIMTYFFSLLSTVLQSILLNLFEDVNIISAAWFLRDLSVMPFADAAYAFFLFVLPWRIMRGKQRSGQDYFSAKR